MIGMAGVCYKYAARRTQDGRFVDWGYSSVGRASRSHREGQGFESPYLHLRHRHRLLIRQRRTSGLEK